jgi:hypothetical protein
MGSSISQEKMAQIEQIVEEIIKNNKIAVFSKSYCRKFLMIILSRYALLIFFKKIQLTVPEQRKLWKASI